MLPPKEAVSSSLFPTPIPCSPVMALQAFLQLFGQAVQGSDLDLTNPFTNKYISSCGHTTPVMAMGWSDGRRSGGTAFL